MLKFVILNGICMLLAHAKYYETTKGYEKLQSYFESQAMYTLMATIATNLLRDQNNGYKEKTYNCFNQSTSVETYAQCLSPLLIKEIKLENILSKSPKRKRLNKKFAPGRHIRDAPNFPPINFTHSSPSISEEIAYFFVSILKNIKEKTGPWFKLPDLNKSRSNPLYGTKLGLVKNFVGNFLKSPLLTFKDLPVPEEEEFRKPELNYENNNVINFPVENNNDEDPIRILSPRFMPFFKREKESSGFLSQDFFSLYEGGSNNIASIPTLLSGLDEKDKNAWMAFFREITGMSDILEALNSPEFAKIIDEWKLSTEKEEAFYMKDTFEVFERTVEDVLKLLTETQIDNINLNGYAFLNETQLDYVYQDKKQELPFDLDDYYTKTDEQKNSMLYEEILLLARPNRDRTRVKRQLANATILAPALGGSILTSYLLAPTILSPAVFSYVILGPLVLSPYILSPYVLAPFILTPELLTPFILNPYVLAPDILVPQVLSPTILSPNVLSPFILSPAVLSPVLLSPSVLSPTILSPGVLSPTILSDSVLGPTILSPCFLCRKK